MAIVKNLFLKHSIERKFGSQRKFASVVSRSNTFVSEVCSGARNLSASEQTQWAVALGEKMFELFKD